MTTRPSGIPSQTELHALRLRVRDLEGCAAFYRDVLGLEAIDDQGGGDVRLALPGRAFTLELVHAPGAPLRPYPCPGLYHFALLLPDRPSLGAALRHVLSSRAPLEGAADHAVSEALYLRDPELNGIELYRDRDPGEWPYRGEEVAMVSDPLDVDDLRAAASDGPVLHPETRIGHIHLHVPQLAAARHFYASGLGLTVTQSTYPGVLFYAWGDYHHHVATNTWAPDRTPPPGATGLLRCTLRCPPGTVARLEEDLHGAGIRSVRAGGELIVTDPAGIELAFVEP